MHAGLRTRLNESGVVSHKKLKRCLLSDIEVDIPAALHPQLHNKITPLLNSSAQLGTQGFH